MGPCQGTKEPQHGHIRYWQVLLGESNNLNHIHIIFGGWMDGWTSR